MALVFTDSNFQDKVLDSDKLTVIDFWAVWCGPCKMVSPIIDELADDYSETVNIGKMDVDTNKGISTKYGVRSIPTVLFIKGGEVVDKIVGAATKAKYQAKIDQYA